MLKTNFEQIAEIAQNTEYSYQFNDSTLQILELLDFDEKSREQLKDYLPVEFMDEIHENAIESQSLDDLIERIDEKLFKGTTETENACKSMLVTIGEYCPELIDNEQSNDEKFNELIDSWGANELLEKLLTKMTIAQVKEQLKQFED